MIHSEWNGIHVGERDWLTDTSYSHSCSACLLPTHSEHREHGRTSCTPLTAASTCWVTHGSSPSDSHLASAPSLLGDEATAATKPADPNLRCWDHGCNGRFFTTLSNLKRHQREQSSSRASHLCPLCGAEFSRTTARNQHIQNQSCTRIRRYSNGRQRISKQ